MTPALHRLHSARHRLHPHPIKITLKPVDHFTHLSSPTLGPLLDPTYQGFVLRNLQGKGGRARKPSDEVAIIIIIIIIIIVIIIIIILYQMSSPCCLHAHMYCLLAGCPYVPTGTHTQTTRVQPGVTRVDSCHEYIQRTDYGKVLCSVQA
jgi:hypothetical protein